MISRKLSLPKKHSFFLFGPRKTGKSTLLHLLFDPAETRYYDFLDYQEYQRFLVNPSAFYEEIIQLPKKIKYVVLDEIQRIPVLLNEVQRAMALPNPRIFCMTGSSARKLKRGHANLLGGRAWLYHLHPLVHTELGEIFNLDKALALGTLPDVYLAEDKNDALQELRSYVEVYVKQEIQAESLTRSLDGFIRFLEYAAALNGCLLNFSGMARECGVSHVTVKQYFEILEDTLMGFLLFPYAKSSTRRLVKHPKFYFFDTGVIRAIKQTLTVPLSPKTEEYGKAFEHFVILEIVRFSQYNNKDWRFSFYRSTNGSEVDLIIETPTQHVYAIEIKSGESVDVGLRGLFSFKEICPKAQLLCVTRIGNRRQRNEITFCPWQEIIEVIK